MNIPLTQGKFAIVDGDVFLDLLSTHRPNWYAQYNPHTKSWYARTNITVAGKSRGKLMHRMIMNAAVGQKVDHINHDTLDNRRCNLRICTQTQNSKNRKINANNTTGFKGVFYRKELGTFRAIVSCDNKKYHVSGFSDAKSAAIAYNELATKLHGKYANLNVIPL